MSVTIRDVAQMAGVSASTVSRVLNGKGAISEETKKRIYDAKEQLKYVPNDFARSFANGSPRAVALVIDVTDPGAYSNNFFNNTVFGIETAAHRRDYSLMITNGSRVSGGLNGVERLILGKKIDGVVFPVSLVSREFIQRVEELSFPCVILGRAEDVGAETSWLDINNTQAGVIAVRHLVSKGYRRIGYLGGPESDLFSRDRLSGCCRELDACGLSVDRGLVLHSEAGSIDEVIAQVTGLLLTENRPDAMVCGSDMLALGAQRAAQRLGLCVPEDFGVLSFDDTAVTALAEPGITSIIVDTFELGVQAAEILIDQIENPGASIRQTLLSTKITARASTERA